MHYLEKALFKAIKADNPGDVKRLINAIDHSSKASRNDKASLLACLDQQSFLHYALELGSYDAFDILFPYFELEDELILSRDQNGRSLFWWAVARGKIDYAKKILTYYQKNQLDSTRWLKPDNEGVSPIHWAAQSSDDAILKWLLSLIPSKNKIVDMVNQVDQDYNTPLHKACIYKKRQNIILLLIAGSAIEIKNNDGKSFIDYLENDSSIFSIADVSNDVKRKLLYQINLELLADPDNQSLINLYKRLSQQTSLLETVRCKINLDIDINGKLDPSVATILDPNKDKRTEQGYYLIGKDRSRLKNYSDQINHYVGKLKRMLQRWQEYGKNFLIAGGFISFLTSIISPVILLLCLLSYDVIFFSKYVAPIIVLSSFVTSPFFIVAVCLLSAAIVAGLVMVGVAIYQKYKINQALNVERVALLAEAKEILMKLDVIEKNDPSQLPVSPQKMHELKLLIATIEEKQYQWGFNTDVNDVVNLMHRLDQSIVDISRAMMASKKPISAVPANEVEGVVELSNSVLNTPPRQLEAVEVAKSTPLISQSPISFWAPNTQVIKSSNAEMMDNTLPDEGERKDAPSLM